MSRPTPIELVQVGDASLCPDLFPALAKSLAELFGAPVTVADTLVTPGEARVGTGAGAGQALSSNVLVDALIARSQSAGASESIWTLGITGHDLFAPDRPFVFGEATLSGSWAIVSVARFGIPSTLSPRLLDRALKESIHELGHLGGVDHCSDSDCPMSRSRTVADVDRKKTKFCGECAERIFARGGS